MKKIFFSSFFAVVAFGAIAQSSKQQETIKLSAGAEVGLPLAAFSESHSAGFGGSAQGEIAIDKSFGITLNAGYLSFIGKTALNISGGQGTSTKQPAVSIIPVLAGAKYYFADQFYGHAQLGMSFFNGGGSAFTWSPGIGFVPSEHIDIALKYVNAGSGAAFMGIRAAYVF